MNIKITKNQQEANLITHNGKFHPDDVFSTVLMSKIVSNPILYRAPVGYIDNQKAIVYDVGYGKFDHHTTDAEYRPNSKLKYCSFGLLWRAYGHEFITKNVETTNPEALFTSIEEKLIKQIDGIDNGIFPKIEAEYKLLDVDKIIDMYNPTWEEKGDTDTYFAKALDAAEIIFENVIRTENSRLKAAQIIEEKIKETKENILILDQFMPYREAIFDSPNPLAKEIKVIILPSNRGGYNIKPRTITKDNEELLVNFPKAYRGLHDDELAQKSGIKTARFVHLSGFLASTETLEDAIALAKQAINNKE